MGSINFLSSGRYIPQASVEEEKRRGTGSGGGEEVGGVLLYQLMEFQHLLGNYLNSSRIGLSERHFSSLISL